MHRGFLPWNTVSREKEAMEKNHNTWKGGSVALFLFVVGIFLFSWPLISVATETGGVVLLSYLFLVWLLVILGIWSYCRNEADSRSDNKSEEDNS
jgi:hypothetical protein